MKIGRTDFGSSIKSVGWTKWSTMWDNNSAMIYELGRKGYTKESAFKFLTGKTIPKKNVRKAEDKPKDD